MALNLDEVDRGILHALQSTARSETAAEMGEKVGTSASTVRNRIDSLEDRVIRGYHPELDYEAAGFDYHLFVTCRAPTVKRTDLAREALTVPGVINVRELTTGADNIHIDLVAVDSDAADDSLASIEAIEDLEILSTQIVNDLHVQPFNHFGADGHGN